MHPVLFEIPFFSGIKIHSYGFMMALGFLAALLWIRFQARREGLPVNRLTDLTFWMMVAAIAGSRLAYILEEWPYYLDHPLEVFAVWEGGLVFLGGLIACMVVAYFYMKKYQLPFWQVSDVFMPGVALGHALGRVGCFLAGCCYGKHCDPQAWYAWVFSGKPGSLAPVGVALYPTQLIEALTEFLTFAFLAWKSQKKAFDGQILLLYLMIYSLLRIGVEVLRGDLERGFVIEPYVSKSQLLSLLLIIFAILALYYRRVHRRGRSS